MKRTGSVYSRPEGSRGPQIQKQDGKFFPGAIIGCNDIVNNKAKKIAQCQARMTATEHGEAEK